jgi:hypothetical protein
MNYSEIQSAVQSYGHRDDSGTVNNIPNAITFAQNWLMQNFAPQQASAITTLTFAASSSGAWAEAALPARFGRFVTVSQPGVGSLGYVDPREFVDLVTAGAFSGVYTIAQGKVLASGSLAGIVCTVLFVEQPAPLLNASDSNYLTADFPDLLVWAAAAEQNRFVQDWDEAANSQGYAQTLLTTYAAAHTAKQQSGGRLTIKG